MHIIGRSTTNRLQELFKVHFFPYRMACWFLKNGVTDIKWPFKVCKCACGIEPAARRFSGPAAYKAVVFPVVKSTPFLPLIVHLFNNGIHSVLL